MTSEPKQVLVTGATGFVGREICRCFIENGYVVFGLARGVDYGAVPEGVVLIQGDLLEPETWSDQVKTINFVVHCAGNAKFGNGSAYLTDNLETTRNIISVAKHGMDELQRFIFISSIAAMDRPFADDCSAALHADCPESPTSDYGKSKLKAEQLVKGSGLPAVILRPAQIVGPSMRQGSHFSTFSRWALEKKWVGRLSFPGIFSVLAVEDFAQAVLVCSEDRRAIGRLYLCGGHHISLRRFFEKLGGLYRLEMSLFVPVMRFAPFALKCLFLPSLKVDDSPLKTLGWSPQKSIWDSLHPVISREKLRVNVASYNDYGQSVVTGAASGLGRAFVEYLAPLRKSLLLVDRDEEALIELSQRFDNCRFLVCDLSDENQVEVLTESALWKANRISELFACAGYGCREAFCESPLQQQVGMMKVNLLARVMLCHKVLPDMIADSFGRIVLISSSSAFQALPGMTSYAASNAGLLSFGEGLSAEVKNLGVRIHTVCPGGMNTNFQAAAGVRRLESEKLMSPQSVVRQVIRGIRQRRAVLIISPRSKMMSFLARLLPRRTSLALWGWLMRKAR